MPLHRQLVRGLRVLFRPAAADQDLSDEVEHYFDECVAFHIARGMSADAARRAARLECGSPVAVREDVRTSGWEHVVETVVADVRHGARRLRESPGFTTLVVITLALGIGATTTMFSAVRPLVFAALPYPAADRIVAIADAGPDRSPIPVTFGTCLELSERSHSLQALAPFKPWQPTVLGTGGPERLAGQRVGAAYFRALGVQPALGRDFTSDDDRAKGPKVVILSSSLWRRRYNGDRAVIGRETRLDGSNFLVIGVMPDDFENVVAPTTEIWTPLQYNVVFGAEDREWGHHLRLVARLRSNVTLQRAREELNEIAGRHIPEFARVPWANLDNGFVITTLQADMTHAIRPAVTAVMVAVGLLLAITCVNVASLLLARGAKRRSELALRAALGANRARLFRELLIEGLLLAVFGGAIGVLMSHVGIATLVAASPPELPRLAAMRLDGGALAFAVAITVLTGLLVGAYPALHGSRHDLRAGMYGLSPTAAAGDYTPRNWLVAAEVALAVMLLISGGLLLQSVRNVFAVPLGFNASHLLTMQVQQSPERVRDDVVSDRVWAETLDAVRAVPAVRAAALTTLLPLSGETDGYGVRLESGRGTREGGAALRYAVSPGFVEAMQIPLRRGRLIDAHDDRLSPRVALVNESFARRNFGAREALGRRLRFGPEEGDSFSIVGVVGDVKQSSLDIVPPDAIYVAAGQWHWRDRLMSLVVRTHGDPSAHTAALRKAIWSVDKDQAIVRIATMDELLRRGVADRRFALLLFQAFGVVALFLAATGIYGILASAVLERTREIGLRSALGAPRSAVVALILRQALLFVIGGVAVGLVVSAALTQGILALLFEISPLDIRTYAAVAGLLLGVSAVASSIPAWRAATVDPSTTLRAQ
jgi:putative ABC transport system permease protein